MSTSGIAIVLVLLLKFLDERRPRFRILQLERKHFGHLPLVGTQLLLPSRRSFFCERKLALLHEQLNQLSNRLRLQHTNRIDVLNVGNPLVAINRIINLA